MAMTPEHVASLVEIKGESDPLEPSIWISTQPFLKARFGGDRFLRANIDKVSGKVFYQLYVSAAFSQSMRFNRMTYLVDGKLKSATADRIYYDVSCQRYGCSHYEHYVVELPRSDLEALAGEASDPSWQARFFGQAVDGVDLLVLDNETAGFLLAVDQVLTRVQKAGDGG